MTRALERSKFSPKFAKVWSPWFRGLKTELRSPLRRKGLIDPKRRVFVVTKPVASGGVEGVQRRSVDEQSFCRGYLH